MTTNYATEPIVINQTIGTVSETGPDGRLLPECTLTFKIKQALILRITALMAVFFENILFPERKATEFVECFTTPDPTRERYLLMLGNVRKRPGVSNERVVRSFLEVLYGPIVADFERPEVVRSNDGAFMAVYSYHIPNGNVIFANLLIDLLIGNNFDPVTAMSIERAINDASTCVYSWDRIPDCSVIEFED
jgi:hypothetical protein